jgi:hypothetical protein
VLENRVQRRIFGPKREEVAGGWKRLHNEELHNEMLGYKMKANEMGEACHTHGKDKCV